MLDARDIRVSLAGTPVLQGVHFRARPGQVTTIVGPNGSGKTTLLRAMTQEASYSGEVTLDGEDISRLPGWQLAARRAVLPQASRIAVPFTVSLPISLSGTITVSMPITTSLFGAVPFTVAISVSMSDFFATSFFISIPFIFLFSFFVPIAFLIQLFFKF